MTSTQIRCFLAAARSSSFSRAAEEIYMSQPTFGRNISTLEQELGIPLFVRGTKSSSLTAAGEVLYRGFCELSDRYEDILTEARRVELGSAGTLTLGLLEGQLLDPQTSELLHRFQCRYPEIHVELARFNFHAMREALKNDELDIGITLTLDMEQQSVFSYVELYTFRNEMVLTKDHPLAQEQGLRLRDFADDVFVEVNPEESSKVSGLMRKSCRDAGFEPQMRYVPDLKSQLLCVELGEGIAAFNEYHQVCNHPNLVHIPLPELPVVSFCATWKKEITNPAVRFFTESLAQMVP